MDLADCFHAIILRNLAKESIDAVGDHYKASKNSKNEVKFWSGYELGNPEEGKNDKKKIAWKYSQGKEDPCLYSVLDTGLQECNQGRPQCYRHRDAEN